MSARVKFSSPGKNGTWGINMDEDFLTSCKILLNFFKNELIEIEVYPAIKPISTKVIIFTDDEFKQFTIYNLTGHQAYLLFKNSLS